jgi:hypothetical protein
MRKNARHAVVLATTRRQPTEISSSGQKRTAEELKN